MSNPTLKTGLAAGALFAILAAAPASAAAGAGDLAPALPEGAAFDCAVAPGLCEEIEALLASAALAATASSAGSADLGGVALTTLYQEVRPNGQHGEFDCVYDSLANRSIIVQRWGVWVEAGTMTGSTRNPIVQWQVYYPFPAVATGNVC